jgi:hypothetical protein
MTRRRSRHDEDDPLTALLTQAALALQLQLLANALAAYDRSHPARRIPSPARPRRKGQ